jgi:hypothetical protein
MKMIICAHSALKINDGSRRRLVLVVRTETTSNINHFVSGCSVQHAVYRLARCASIVYLLRIFYTFDMDMFYARMILL